jgi:hypothetical protein
MNDNKTAAVAPAIAPAGLLGRATRFRLVCALFLVIGLFAAGPCQAAAQDPRAFVAELGHQAIQVLGRNVPSAQRIARFRELFHDDFDVSGIGQFVLGRYWRVATPAEQQEFLRLFQEYIVQSYATRLANMAGSRSESLARGHPGTKQSFPARSIAPMAAVYSSTGICSSVVVRRRSAMSMLGESA